MDSDVDNRYGKFTFIDTAGLRKRGKVEDGVERYSVLRSLAAVERAKVCVIMIDATEGFTEQDSKVAGFAHEQGKACIIASTNGTRWRKTIRPWMYSAKS